MNIISVTKLRESMPMANKWAERKEKRIEEINKVLLEKAKQDLYSATIVVDENDFIYFLKDELEKNGYKAEILQYGAFNSAIKIRISW